MLKELKLYQLGEFTINITDYSKFIDAEILQEPEVRSNLTENIYTVNNNYSIRLRLEGSSEKSLFYKRVHFGEDMNDLDSIIKELENFQKVLIDNNSNNKILSFKNQNQSLYYSFNIASFNSLKSIQTDEAVTFWLTGEENKVRFVLRFSVNNGIFVKDDLSFENENKYPPNRIQQTLSFGSLEERNNAFNSIIEAYNVKPENVLNKS
jgi:hypothetical protein